MKKLIHILFFIVVQFSFGQIPNFKIDSILLNKIEQFDVDKIGFTRKSCTGYGVNSVGYLFWETELGTLMQKIEFIEYPKEILKEYKPFYINDDFFFDFFRTNQQSLMTDKEIKRIKIDVEEIEADGIIITGYPLTSHSCYRLILIKEQNYNFSKEFDYFNLVKSLPQSKDKLNMNLEFNDNLTIIKWDKLINSHIEKIEKSKKFELISPE